jgi:hypothetical protein
MSGLVLKEFIELFVLGFFFLRVRAAMAGSKESN